MLSLLNTALSFATLVTSLTFAQAYVYPARLTNDPLNCNSDEKFESCGWVCVPTCDSLLQTEDIRVCTDECLVGCFCKEGLFRNSSGVCVPRSACQQQVANETQRQNSSVPLGNGSQQGSTRQTVNNLITPERPVSNRALCRSDEDFRTCGSDCEMTCSTPENQLRTCSAKCLQGCFCKSPLIRAQDGRCVPAKECGEVNETTGLRPVTSFPEDIAPGKQDIYPERTVNDDRECRPDENFQTCGSACDETCSVTLQLYSQICTEQCIYGCFCNKPLIRAANGSCVPRESCLPPSPQPNFILARRPIETLEAPTGVLLPLVSVSPGRPTYDPRDCEYNEEYRTCGSACDRTCSNYLGAPPNVCTYECVSGCFCKSALVRSLNGSCVPIQQCGMSSAAPGVDNRSPRNFGFSRDNPSTTYQPLPIRDSNQEFFFVERGTAVNEPREMIRPGRETFDPSSCWFNEQFKTCGSDCDETCSTLVNGTSPVCPPKCTIGCFCKPPLVRGPDGVCVERLECNQGQADNNNNRVPGEELATRGSSLYPNRGNSASPLTAVSSPARSVQYPSSCRPEEEFRSCGSSCDETCGTLLNLQERVCALSCTSGCFCRQPYVRSLNGTCIYKEQCQQAVNQDVNFKTGATSPNRPAISSAACGNDETFVTCGNNCTGTCQSSLQPQQVRCGSQCESGCYCRQPLVRAPNGRCVPVAQCPQGGRQEDTANIFFSPGFNSGDTRNPSVNIRPERPVRSASECRSNENFQTCGSTCEDTCLTVFDNERRACTYQCVSGCFCNQPLVRSSDGNCIPRQNCPLPIFLPSPSLNGSGFQPAPFSPQLLIPQTSQSNPWRSQDRQSSGRNVQNPGRRNDSNVNLRNAVHPNRTTYEPRQCYADEVFKTCGSDCEETCSTLTDSSSENRRCGTQCLIGCFCREGLYRANDGSCVDKTQCFQDANGAQRAPLQPGRRQFRRLEDNDDQQKVSTPPRFFRRRPNQRPSNAGSVRQFGSNDGDQRKVPNSYVVGTNPSWQNNNRSDNWNQYNGNVWTSGPNPNYNTTRDYGYGTRISSSGRFYRPTPAPRIPSAPTAVKTNTQSQNSGLYTPVNAQNRFGSERPSPARPAYSRPFTYPYQPAPINAPTGIRRPVAVNPYQPQLNPQPSVKNLPRPEYNFPPPSSRVEYRFPSQKKEDISGEDDVKGQKISSG